MILLLINRQFINFRFEILIFAFANYFRVIFFNLNIIKLLTMIIIINFIINRINFKNFLVLNFQDYFNVIKTLIILFLNFFFQSKN